MIVRIVLEEGTKTRLVLGREIQESPILLLLHFSPSNLMTKRACPLYQCIAIHTTTMNKGAWSRIVVRKVVNMGFSKRRASLLSDGLFND